MGKVVSNTLAGIPVVPTDTLSQAAIDAGTLLVREAYSLGFSRTYYAFMPVCVVGWIIVLFLKHVPLRGHGPGGKKKEEKPASPKEVEAGVVSETSVANGNEKQ